MKKIISFAIDEKLLADLDQTAEAHGKSRSRVLRETVANYLTQRDLGTDSVAFPSSVRQNPGDAISVEPRHSSEVTGA